MRTKSLTFGITAIATVLALLIPTAAFAGSEVFVGTYTYDWTTYDNGMEGLWATDFFHSQVSIWDLGDDYYRVVFVDGGTFETLDANSPGGNGHVDAGITGNVYGGVSIIVAGDLEEEIPSHIGPIDYRSGGGWSNYLSPFFDDFQIVEWESWGWSFVSCGNGTWVDNEETEAIYNSEGPNPVMGDVVGERVACETSTQEPVVKNLWAYVNPGATDEAARGNICYILSQTQPIQNVELDKENAVRRLCYTTDSPDWWQGAVLLTHGDVFENGTDFGFWEGDAAARAFSSALRKPLHADAPAIDLTDLAEMYPWTQ